VDLRSDCFAAGQMFHQVITHYRQVDPAGKPGALLDRHDWGRRSPNATEMSEAWATRCLRCCPVAQAYQPWIVPDSEGTSAVAGQAPLDAAGTLDHAWRQQRDRDGGLWLDDVAAC
jgi:hypothetical protein